MSELENYDQDRLFRNFFKYRFHLIVSSIVIVLLAFGRNLYFENNIANTSYLYDFNKIVLDFASDPSSENLYSELNEFLDNNENSQYSYYISSMLSYTLIIVISKRLYHSKQNIFKNDNAIRYFKNKPSSCIY